MKNPTIRELRIVDTRGDNDCEECYFYSFCTAICSLPNNKHYEV